MADPQISSLLQHADRPLLSLEFFPPKTTRGMENLKRNVDQLKLAKPDFVTVTYGAGGTTQARTMELCDLLRSERVATVMPHLTCVASSRAELVATADQMYLTGYRNIMALRGDPPEGSDHFEPHPDGLAHASDLVQLLHTRYPDLCCGVAGYPEAHPEAASLDDDIRFVKVKQDAGAAFVTTQLFYRNTAYFDFVARCRDAGIEIPIVPGLLPAVSLDQVRRITAMCGASLPEDLERGLAEAGEDKEKAEEVGIAWVAAQIDGLIRGGAPGVHLYILNRARTALAAIIECFKYLRP